MIVQVITVRLIQTQNHGNLKPADGAPTVGGEIWCSVLSTHAFLLGNGQTYATRGVPYYRVSRIFMSRIFSVPAETSTWSIFLTLFAREQHAVDVLNIVNVIMPPPLRGIKRYRDPSIRPSVCPSWPRCAPRPAMP